MSEQDTEVAATGKAKRPAPEVTEVKMADGRTVAFVGKRKMLKFADVSADGISLRFDFVNGETRHASIAPSDPLFAQYAAHGALQKIGDETAGVEDVGDMLLNVDAVLERLAKGEWGAERKAGDGFSGASVVVKAIVEASGKDIAFVKGFLEKKLADGKEKGLTRQKLYAAYRAPGTKTAAIIERLEREKAAGLPPAVDADAELAEMANS